MTIEDQITALLAKAEPLRLLDDIEAETQGLGRIVEQINALRAEQADALRSQLHAIESAILADTVLANKAAFNVEAARDAANFEAERQEVKRKPGRPKKVEAA